jgi:hypothetical protein
MVRGYPGFGGKLVFGDEFEGIPVRLQFEFDGLDKGGMPGNGRSGCCHRVSLFQALV